MVPISDLTTVKYWNNLVTVLFLEKGVSKKNAELEIHVLPYYQLLEENDSVDIQKILILRTKVARIFCQWYLP